MAIPTFNSVPLCSAAARDEPGPVAVRAYVQTMPGADGQFVQLHGSGGRDIRMTGVLEGPGASPAGSHEALKSAFRNLQALADGSTVATYVGTDGASYDFCMLTSYRATGPAGVSKETSGYSATVEVEALIRQLQP